MLHLTQLNQGEVMAKEDAATVQDAKVVVAETITDAEAMEIIKAVVMETEVTAAEVVTITQEQRDSILEARGTQQKIGAIETDDAQQNPQGNDGAAMNASLCQQQILPPLEKLFQGWPVNANIIATILKLVNTLS
jgi:hypothetical protein